MAAPGLTWLRHFHHRQHVLPVPPCIGLVNSFDEGTSGTGLTTGNTASATDNAADTIQAAGGATLTFDNTHAAHRTLSCKVVNTTTQAATFQWTTSIGTQSAVWFRVYLYFTGNPAATARVFRAQGAGAALCGAMAISTTGKILMLNSAGTTILTSAATMPLNAWFRVEGYIECDASNGQLSFSLFTSNIDAPVTSPDETQTSATGQSTLGAATGVTYGVTATAGGAVSFWMDDIGFSSCGYVGPALLPVAVPAPAQPPPLVSRRVLARAVTGPRNACAAGVAAPPVPSPFVQPLRLPAVAPRKPPVRVVFRGITGLAQQPIVLPRPPPTAIARKGPARAIWRGSVTRTTNAVFVAATPAPKRLPPQPRKPPAAVTWRGTVVRTVNATPGTVPVTALQRPLTIPRKPPARAVTRGLPAPFRYAQPVLGGIVRRRAPARGLWQRVLGAARTAQPLTGGSISRRQPSRVTWRGTIIKITAAAGPPPVPGCVTVTDRPANLAITSDTAIGAAAVTDTRAGAAATADIAAAAVTITDQKAGAVTTGDQTCPH